MAVTTGRLDAAAPRACFASWPTAVTYSEFAVATAPASYSAAAFFAGAAGVAVVFFAAAGFFSVADFAGAGGVFGLKNPKLNSDESGAFGLTPPA